jgi:hypothetical protein
MQNYIPLIIKFPIARDFFKKYPDWYSNFQRDLTFDEDDMRIDDMNVFLYRWKAKDEKLNVIIDRETFSICGLENNNFKILCGPSIHETTIGSSQEFRLYIKNKTSERIRCSLQVTCEEGLEFSKTMPKSFKLEPKTEKILKDTLIISSKTEIRKSEDPAHQIQINLSINKELIPLVTGIRLRPCVDFTFDPEHFCGVPGYKNKVITTLKSNIKHPIQGFIAVKPNTSIHVYPLKQPFSIPVEGHFETSFHVEIPENNKSSVIPLLFKVISHTEKGEVEIRKKTYHIKSFTSNTVLSTIEDDILVLENELVRVSFELEGGILKSFISKQSGTTYINSLTDTIGPPFVFTELEKKKFSYEIHRENGGVRVRLYANLESFKGLKIIKDFFLAPLSETIKIQYSFINSHDTCDYNFRLNIRAHKNMRKARLVLPLKEGIVRATIDGDYPQFTSDIPDKPKRYSESWICIEFPNTCEILGILWHPDRVLKRTNNELLIESKTMTPHSTVFFEPIYLIGGFGNWRKIAHFYRNKVEYKERNPWQEKTESILKVITNPLTINTPEKTDFTVTIKNRRKKSISGDLKIKSPPGWTVNPKRFKVKDIKIGKPFKGKIILSPKPESRLASGSYKGNLRISSNLTEIKQPFNFFILGGKGEVRVHERLEKGENIFIVDNGRIEFKLCPSFAGTFFSLVDKNTGVNHLLSSFPRTKPYGETNPWYGGVRFLVWKDPYGVQTHKEKFNCKKIKEKGWDGVSLSTELKDAVRELKGIVLEEKYLTKPQSNIIMRVFRIQNKSLTTMVFKAKQNAFLQVGGSIKENIAYFKKEDTLISRKRIRGTAWVDPSENWLQVTNIKTRDSIVMVSASGNKNNVVLEDYGILGTNLSIETNISILPQMSKQFLSYIIITKGLKTYEDYRFMPTLL